MLFGQSVFQSVLTRLKHEQEEDGGQTCGEAESFRIRGLGAGFVASTGDEMVDSGTGTDAYFAFLRDEPEHGPEEAPPSSAPEPSEPPTPPRPQDPFEPAERPLPRHTTTFAEEPLPAPPAHLLRLTEEEIAAELAISTSDTQASLADKRRRFAKANHPDRVAPQFRGNAHIRMQTANLLIDRAIRRLAWR